MTSAQAKILTGLSVRENPQAFYEYLRCLLGEYEAVEIKLSAYRSAKEKVFRLVAFGSSWENAVSMWEKAQKGKA